MNTRNKVSEIIGNAIAELKKLDLTQDDFAENAGVVIMSCIVLEDGSLANQQAIVGSPSHIQATITMQGSENEKVEEMLVKGVAGIPMAKLLRGKLNEIMN